VNSREPHSSEANPDPKPASATASALDCHTCTVSGRRVGDSRRRALAACEAALGSTAPLGRSSADYVAGTQCLALSGATKANQAARVLPLAAPPPELDSSPLKSASAPPGTTTPSHHQRHTGRSGLGGPHARVRRRRRSPPAVTTTRVRHAAEQVSSWRCPSRPPPRRHLHNRENRSVAHNTKPPHFQSRQHHHHPRRRRAQNPFFRAPGVPSRLMTIPSPFVPFQRRRPAQTYQPTTSPHHHQPPKPPPLSPQPCVLSNNLLFVRRLEVPAYDHQQRTAFRSAAVRRGTPSSGAAWGDQPAAAAWIGWPADRSYAELPPRWRDTVRQGSLWSSRTKLRRPQAVPPDARCPVQAPLHPIGGSPFETSRYSGWRVDSIDHHGFPAARPTSPHRRSGDYSENHQIPAPSARKAAERFQHGPILAAPCGSALAAGRPRGRSVFSRCGFEARPVSASVYRLAARAFLPTFQSQPFCARQHRSVRRGSPAFDEASKHTTSLWRGK